MNAKIIKISHLLAFDNDFDTALIPEVWAQETLMVLVENMLVSNLVHTDYSNEVKKFGETIHTNKPEEFEAKRKTKNDNVTIQDAVANDVEVKLNQHIHTSFIIKDEELAKGMDNVIVKFLAPAGRSLARMVDQVLLAQAYQFMTYNAGKLSTDLTKATVIAAREVMNTNNVPLDDRQFILTPSGESDLLEVVDFTNAEKIGDDGTAMREGSVGRKMGFNFFMCQNTPNIATTGITTKTGAVVNAHAAGVTSVVTDGFGTAPVAGEWCTFAGDMTPQFITAYNASSGAITISPGLKYAVVNDAVVTVYTAGSVDLSAGYEANYSKEIVCADFTNAPKKGHLISFGTSASTARYGTVGTSTTTSIVVDRPLVEAIANNDLIGVGPSGNYNFAFHRNAMALVGRAMRPPLPGTGALSYVAVDDDLNLPIRVVITYDGNKQGHLVTFDLLLGIKILDQKLGCVIYS